MPWPCVLLEIDPTLPFEDQTRTPGTLWYGDLEYASHEQIMGSDYKVNRAGKRPLWVRLPGGRMHCIDGASYNGTAWGPGWVVNGEPPNITVTPSINHPGVWHGYITNGIVSDDLEGRVYATPY